MQIKTYRLSFKKGLTFIVTLIFSIIFATILTISNSKNIKAYTVIEINTVEDWLALDNVYSNTQININNDLDFQFYLDIPYIKLNNSIINGNSHTISNINIENDEVSALISDVENNSLIYDLNINGARVTANISKERQAILVGSITDSKIFNCHISGLIEFFENEIFISSTYMFSALVGLAVNSELENLSNAAAVFLNVNNYNLNYAGIVETLTTSTLINIKLFGKIELNESNSLSLIAGVCLASIDSTIQNIYSTNDSEIICYNSLLASSIIGFIQNSIVNNIISETIIKAFNTQMITGIIGYTMGENIISDLINRGDLENMGAASIIVSGIIGTVNPYLDEVVNDFKNLTNYGNINLVLLNTSITQSIASGIIAMISPDVKLRLNDTVNNGLITTKNIYITGGIIGNNSGNLELNDAINYGNIINENLSGDNNTQTSSGGIVGSISAFNNPSSLIKVNIKNTINIGDIKSSSIMVGGIIGGSNIYFSLLIELNLQNNINGGNITGALHAGGLIGLIGSNNIASIIKIDRFINSGMIKGYYAAELIGSIYEMNNLIEVGNIIVYGNSMLDNSYYINHPLGGSQIAIFIAKINFYIPNENDLTLIGIMTYFDDFADGRNDNGYQGISMNDAYLFIEGNQNNLIGFEEFIMIGSENEESNVLLPQLQSLVNHENNEFSMISKITAASRKTTTLIIEFDRAIISKILILEGMNLLDEHIPELLGHRFIRLYSDIQLTAQLDLPYLITDDAILYANYEANLYEITFNFLEESISVIKEILFGVPLDINPLNLFRTGYYIQWFDDPSFNGHEYEISELYKYASDLVLYGKWAPQVFEVLFNAQNNTTNELRMIVFNTRISDLPIPIKNGYEFQGWFTQKNGLGKEITINMFYEIPSNITLYAFYIAQVFTVSFNSDGGLTSIAAIEVSFDSSLPLLAPIIKADYNFVNWIDENGNIYQSGDIYTLTTNLVLYASWQAIKPIILSDLNNLVVNESFELLINVEIDDVLYDNNFFSYEDGILTVKKTGVTNLSIIAKNGESIEVLITIEEINLEKNNDSLFLIIVISGSILSIGLFIIYFKKFSVIFGKKN